jgi:hypothetical protein
MSFSSDQAILINQLPISAEFDKDQEKFLEQLGSLYKRIAQSVNNKEGGLYSLQELYNSQLFFMTGNPQQFRNVYRKVFDVVDLNGGNIPAAGAVSFPHNINGILYATNIYASCTSTTNEFFTVVYDDATMDAANLYFTNPLPATPLKSVLFVAEYLKN